MLSKTQLLPGPHQSAERSSADSFPEGKPRDFSKSALPQKNDGAYRREGQSPSPTLRRNDLFLPYSGSAAYADSFEHLHEHVPPGEGGDVFRGDEGDLGEGLAA